MPLNEELVRLYRSFEDPEAGVREEFHQPRLGPGRTVAVLSRPTGSSSSVGWVLCHSFGIEQVNLHRLEVLTARAMAAAGFPVLRFHVQGYGDAERRGEPVDVAWHVDGTADALSFVRTLDGVEAVGLIGFRFGALVAALVADRGGVAHLGLVQPYVTGSHFLNEFLQTALFEQMFDTIGQQAETPRSLLDHLDSHEWKDLNGFRLTLQAYQRIIQIDLTSDVRRFRGSALVLGLSRSGEMPEEPARLAAHLGSIGAECSTEAIAEKWAHMLGQHHFMKVGDGEVERDVFFETFPRVAASVVRWANRTVADRLPSPAAPG